MRKHTDTAHLNTLIKKTSKLTNAVQQNKNGSPNAQNNLHNSLKTEKSK